MNMSGHVFAIKLITERRVSSINEKVYLLLCDMSKAFDSIHRNTLIEDLKNTLNQDKMQTNVVTIQVIFCTDTEAHQGDCASFSKFFYQVKSLESTDAIDAPALEEPNTMQDQISKTNNAIVSQSYQTDITRRIKNKSNKN